MESPVDVESQRATERFELKIRFLLESPNIAAVTSHQI